MARGARLAVGSAVGIAEREPFGVGELPEPLRAVLRAAPPVRDYVIESDASGITITLRLPPPPGTPSDPPLDDPFATARAAGNVERQRLLAEQGETWSAAEVALRLGISRQAVDKRRQAGKLVAVELGRRGLRYPAWQLRDGDVLPGLEAALASLAGSDPWSVLLFLGSPNAACDGQLPRTLLLDGGDDEIALVTRAATAWMEHGAV
jgi:hypothetical protein